MIMGELSEEVAASCGALVAVSADAADEINSLGGDAVALRRARFFGFGLATASDIGARRQGGGTVLKCDFTTKKEFSV